MKPPFTYFGGKLLIADQIAGLLPAHEHYIEPFAGSLAVLMAKPPAKMETVNDLSGDLMNFWRVLRDRPADLERVCALTPHSRAEYLAAYQVAADELERARRTWVMLTQGRGGRMTTSSGWRRYGDPRGRPHSSMPDYLEAYVGRMAPAAARLRSVSLECLPALDVIDRYGKHDACLIYADPPYLRSTRKWDNGPAYAHELRTEAEHRELAGALLAARAAVVLSGYHSPLYDELYGGWWRAEIRSHTSNSAGDKHRTEVLWSNRPFPTMQATLYDVSEAQ